MKKQKNLLIPYVVLILWMFVIFLFSHQIADDSSNLSGSIVDTIKPYAPGLAESILTFLVRKSAHMLLYAVLGVLLYRLIAQSYANTKKPILWSVVAAGAYALTDELHQTFVPGRSGEVRDVLIDMVGALLGIAAYLGVQWLRRRYIARHPKADTDTRSSAILALNKVSVTVVLLAFVVALVPVGGSDLLPTRMKLLALGGGALPVAGLCWLLLTNKSNSAIKNVLLVLCSVLIVAGSSIAISTSRSTTDFVRSLQSTEQELQSYSIVALKSSPANLDQPYNSIGYVLDQQSESLLQAIKKRTDAAPSARTDITTLAVALTDNELDTLVIRGSHLELLYENYRAFYDTLVVLDTFDVAVPKAAPAEPTDTTKPFVVYISGIDTYGDVATVSRSDVNILAVVNPITRKVLLVNTPRDYYVALHGISGSKDKLTHAGIYGIAMSQATLADLYETEIDMYLRINFNSLIRVVDSLGGVTVQSDQAFKSGKYSFVQGANNLDGEAALAFSRTRYGFSDGDRTRGKNQQKVITAIIDRIITPNVIVKNQNLLQALEGTIQTDASEAVTAQIIKTQLETIGQWSVESISVTGSDAKATTYSMGKLPLYVMQPDVASVNNAKAKIQGYLQ